MLRTELIRPIPELLGLHALERGDKLAFRDARRSVTYAELATRTARLAGNLRSHGLDRGDRAVIYMDNSVEVVESYLAITRASAVGVCINSQAAEHEAGYMVEHSGARVILTDPGHVERALALASQMPAIQDILVTGAGNSSATGEGARSYEEASCTEPDLPALDDLGLDEPAWMLYTSGTTGRPKGVLLTQRSCLWVVAACWAPITGLSDDDYVLSPLPLFHSYALDLSVLGVLAVGASEYIMDHFSTNQVLTLLRDEAVTFFPGVPTMFHYLLETAGRQGLHAAKLRTCVSAGNIMSATLNQEFEQAFHIPLLDGYGITETSTMVTQNWPTGTRVMGSCGLPLPGSEVRIVDLATGKDTNPGQDGELWVRGPHVMVGYYNQPNETAEVLQEGWYHTGDLGRRDEHGYLTISGRVKELIIRGGENIYPAEIERVLLGNDTILDAAVIGRADEHLGEVPVAFVVPRGHPDRFNPASLFATCREELTYFKVPAEIHVVDAIPRTGSGKILRHKLRDSLPGTAAWVEEQIPRPQTDHD